MQSVSIQIAVDNSGAFIKAMHSQAAKALEECGLVAERYAKDNLTKQGAVDTGNLRNSVTHKVVMNDRENVCYIGTPVEYGIYIEFGTGSHYKGGRKTSWVYKDAKGNWHRTNGMKARPYLRPAVAEHKDEYEKIIKDELQN